MISLHNWTMYMFVFKYITSRETMQAIHTVSRWSRPNFRVWLNQQKTHHLGCKHLLSVCPFPFCLKIIWGRFEIVGNTYTHIKDSKFWISHTSKMSDMIILRIHLKRKIRFLASLYVWVFLRIQQNRILHNRAFLSISYL